MQSLFPSARQPSAITVISCWAPLQSLWANISELIVGIIYPFLKANLVLLNKLSFSSQYGSFCIINWRGVPSSFNLFQWHFKLSKFAPTTIYHGAFWLLSFIIMGLEICYFLHIQEFFTGALITVFYRVCS